MTTRRRAGFSAGLLLAGALLWSCAYVGGQTEPYRPPEAVEEQGPQSGRELYLSDCAWCHGSRGRGTNFGPDLLGGTNGPALTDYVLATGRMPIDTPDEVVRPGEPQYSSEEIKEIVDYVASFGQPGPEIPHPEPEHGDLAHGAELYQENCAACHSTTGIGGALTSGRPSRQEEQTTEGEEVLAPPLDKSTPTEVAEAMITGPGTMPVFGEGTFSKEDIDSVVRYVEYLQEPKDEGGQPIGRVGPVAEGAVGWIVGLGVLLLLSRWIGTKIGEEE